MKVERYYDICCERCGKHRSTDFEKGMEESRDLILALAKKEGWRTRSGENLCPDCIEEIKSKRRAMKKIMEWSQAVDDER